MVFEVPSNNCVNSRLVALDLSYNELGGLLPTFMGAREREREREMMCLWCEGEREVRERRERRESVFFFEYNTHLRLLQLSLIYKALLYHINV
jgi:hypothetical protein